jgi:hypothetical protein
MQHWRCSLVDRIILAAIGLFFTGAAGFLVFAIATEIFPSSDGMLAAGRFVAVLFLAMGVFGGLLFFAYAGTRFTIADQRLEMVLPTWHGHMPTPPMREYRFSPGELRAVQVREEVRRSMGATLIGPALMLETAGGERIFAYRCLADKLGALPLSEIAVAIGREMQCAVDDHGLVEVGAWRTDDAASWAAKPLPPEQAVTARTSAARYAKIVAAVITVALLVRACGALLHD